MICIQVVNHGVEVLESDSHLVGRVVELANQYYQDVPVLVIASSQDELTVLHEALRTRGEMPAEEVSSLPIASASWM